MAHAAYLLLFVLSFALAGCERPAPSGDARAPAESGESLSPNARPDITQHLREDRDAVRHPGDGGGRAFVRDALPVFEASSLARIPFRYEAGPHGVAVGGSLQFQAPSSWGWSPPQILDPGAPGYTRVESEAPGVELDVAVREDGVLIATVTGRALAEGEQVRFVYGEGLGARVDRFAERDAPLFVAVDADGDDVRGFVRELPRVTIGPGPPARLVLLVPSTAAPGAVLVGRIAVLDAQGNAGVPWAGTIALEADDPSLVLPARVTIAAEDRGRASFPLRVEAAGIYRVIARADDLDAESNPLVVDERAPPLLWADLHGHSHFSDGTGTPDDYFRYAREIAALDVAALTDHDHWGIPFVDGTPGAWDALIDAARAHHAPGEFVTLPGFEWTSWLHGHRHVLYFAERGPLVSSLDEATDAPDELWAALRDEPALTFAHHSAGGPVATNWDYAPDPALEPVTEIVSVHGNSESLSSPHVISQPIAGHFVSDVLARGYRLGFVGSGDSHDGHPGLAHLASPNGGGLAAIRAPARTRAAVSEALHRRACYATNGPRIVLDVELSGRPMGDRVPPGDHTLSVRIAAPGPLARVELVHRGGVLRRFEPSETEPVRDLAFGDDVTLAAPDYVYVRAVQRDGGAAWSSPIFVDEDAPPLDPR